MKTKHCSLCQQDKPLADFNNHSKRADGKQSFCRTCGKRYARKYMPAYQQSHAGKLSALRSDLKRRFSNFTVEQYMAISEAQDDACLICKEPCPRGRLSVDHDHQTGRIRGLLCRTCNIGISAFKESPDTIEAAKQYVLDRCLTQ